MFAIDEAPLKREVDEAGGDAVLPDGQLAHDQGRSRGRLQQGERIAQRRVGLIDLVEEQEARNALFLELAQDQLERGQLARIGFADDHGRIADGQHVAHVLHEFDRPRQVDEGVAVTEIFGRGDVGLDAHGVGAGFGAGVADSGAVTHAALPLQCAGAREDGFEKCGLATLEGAHERDQPWPRNSSRLVLNSTCHGTLPHSARRAEPVVGARRRPVNARMLSRDRPGRKRVWIKRPCA